jgi:hypothetical protein
MRRARSGSAISGSPTLSCRSGRGQNRNPTRLPVLVMVCGYSCWLSAALIPSRTAQDLSPAAGHGRRGPPNPGLGRRGRGRSPPRRDHRAHRGHPRVPRHPQLTDWLALANGPAKRVLLRAPAAHVEADRQRCWCCRRLSRRRAVARGCGCRAFTHPLRRQRLLGASHSHWPSDRGDRRPGPIPGVLRRPPGRRPPAMLGPTPKRPRPRTPRGHTQARTVEPKVELRCLSDCCHDPGLLESSRS